MDESLIEAVLRRAGYACEYCLRRNRSILAPTKSGMSFLSSTVAEPSSRTWPTPASIAIAIKAPICRVLTTPRRGQGSCVSSTHGGTSGRGTSAGTARY
jgi:hypothetical protein